MTVVKAYLDKETFILQFYDLRLKHFFFLILMLGEMGTLSLNFDVLC
jgi:hypothetical protein